MDELAERRAWLAAGGSWRESRRVQQVMDVINSADDAEEAVELVVALFKEWDGE